MSPVSVNLPTRARTNRVARIPARLGAALGAVVLAIGCAHAAGPAGGGEPLAPTEGATGTDQAIYRPLDRVEARDMLEEAFRASAHDDHATAVELFGAVLGTDFLTDEGRANLYWMKAEAHRQLEDRAARVEALGGFLLASELIDIDEDLETRRLLARSALAAIRVAHDPGFGRTPEMAITVEDVREPASIMASLSCGPSGQGRYVDVTIRSVRRAGEDGQLLHRRAECRPSGRTLELWFDLSRAELTSE